MAIAKREARVAMYIYEGFHSIATFRRTFSYGHFNEIYSKTGQMQTNVKVLLTKYVVL